MHKQIFVFDNASYSAGNISALTANLGGLTFAGSGAGTPATIDPKTIDINGGFNTQKVFVIGHQYGGLTTSPEFTLKDVKAARKVAYSVGVKQVSTFSITVNSTKFIGDEIVLHIVDTTLGTATPKRNTYTYVASSTSYSAINALDEIRTQIRADYAKGDSNITVTSNAGEATLTLEGRNFTTTFRLAAEGDYATKTIAYTGGSCVSAKPGNGYAVQIASIEEECFSKQYGVTNKVGYPVKKPSTIAVNTVNKTFDLFVFDIEIANLDRANQGQSRVAPFKLIIAEAINTNTDGTFGKALYDAVTDFSN